MSFINDFDIKAASHWLRRRYYCYKQKEGPCNTCRLFFETVLIPRNILKSKVGK